MKYVTRPKQTAGEDEPLYTHITVIEEERAPIPTGLLNHLGDEIYRERDTVPFGFRAKS